MFTKFHWGHGIAVFYCFFVAVLIYALISSFGVDHSLVVEDYYQEDLEYQSRYEKESNAINNQDIEVNYDASLKQILLEFKEIESISGTAHFYRPSDKSKDFKVSVTKVNQSISTEKIIGGKWIIKLDCVVDGEPIYVEKIIFI